MFWRQKDDPVARFRSDLLRAVNDGSLDAVKRVIAEDIDVPLGVLGTALDRAVSREQLKIAEALLARGAKVSAIGIGTARTVVTEERHDAFRLLHGHGLDFARFISNDDSAYKLRLRYMLRTLECEKLREELRQLREETTCPVTPPQTGRTAEKTQAPRRPGPKDGSLSL